MKKEWYVVNTYSGHENKVKEKLEMRAESMNMGDYIYRVVVPVEKNISIKDVKNLKPIINDIKKMLLDKENLEFVKNLSLKELDELKDLLFELVKADAIEGSKLKFIKKLDKALENLYFVDNSLVTQDALDFEEELKNKTKNIKLKKTFPGYVLIEMIMTDDAWFVVRNTPGVTGFIGSSGKGAKPFPLTKDEIDKILYSQGMNRNTTVEQLAVNDKVKILSGPFVNMEGTVKNIDLANNVVDLVTNLFGQESEVEVNLLDVEKI